MSIGARLGWLVVAVAAAAAVGLAGSLGLIGEGGPGWGIAVGMAVAALASLRAHLLTRRRVKVLTERLATTLDELEHGLAVVADGLARRSDPVPLAAQTERLRLDVARRRTRLGRELRPGWVKVSRVVDGFERRAAHWVSVRVRSEIAQVWGDAVALETALVALAADAANRQARSMVVVIDGSSRRARFVIGDDGVGLVDGDSTAVGLIEAMGGTVVIEVHPGGNEIRFELAVPRRTPLPTVAAGAAILALMTGLTIPVRAHHDPGHGGGPPSSSTTTVPTTTTTTAPTTTTSAPTTTTSAPTTTTTAPASTTTSSGAATTVASTTTTFVPALGPAVDQVTTSTTVPGSEAPAVIPLPTLPLADLRPPTRSVPEPSGPAMAMIGVSAVTLAGLAVLDVRWFSGVLRRFTPD